MSYSGPQTTPPNPYKKDPITWTGSLVGSTNPNQVGGFKRKQTDEDKEFDDSLPSSVVVQFMAANGVEGEGGFPTMDVPIGTTVSQLEALINSMINGDSTAAEANSTPYAFYLSTKNSDTDKTDAKSQTNEDLEISTSLLASIKTANSKSPFSTENTITITYHPLAVFKVRPVTRCTDTMPGHTDAILHVTYSPDGKNLASGGGDTTVRFWDVNTCLPKYTCIGHKNHVLSTAWSPDGKRFASADKNGVLIIWDPKTGKMQGSPMKAHTKWITSLSWEPMHRNQACERLVTSSKDNLCKIWNVRTHSCEATLSGHTDSVECVKWGGEGFIYTCSRDRTIKVWGGSPSNVSANDIGKLVKTLTGHGHRVNSLALSCDYVCRTGPYDHNGNAFPNDDEAFKSACDRYNALLAQGPERLVSGSDDFTLFFWNPTTSKHPLKRLTGHMQAVNHIAFSPCGRYFASGSFDKKVKLWDGRNGNFVATLTGHVGAVYHVSWSSDSRYIVSASKDSTVKLWEVANTKRCKETLPGHQDEVYALDWAPNGTSVASGSKDRTIKIWKH